MGGILEGELNRVRSVVGARTLVAALEQGLITIDGSSDDLRRLASIRICGDDIQHQLNAARADASARTLHRAEELGIIRVTPIRSEETVNNLHPQPPASGSAPK